MCGLSRECFRLFDQGLAQRTDNLGTFADFLDKGKLIRLTFLVSRII